MNDIVEAPYTDFPYICIQRIYKYEDRKYLLRTY